MHKSMNKDESPNQLDEMRPEYDLAELLKGGVRGKYAERYRQATNVVVLAPDVAQAFPTEADVNRALRLVMQLAQVPHLERDIIEDKVQAALFEKESTYDIDKSGK
jgi:hypothetical protein